VNEGAADAYFDRETIIKTILKPDRLDNAKSTIKKLIQGGVIVGSQLPQKFAQKASAKKEYNDEFQIAVAYISSLISKEAAENARKQAAELNDKASKEKSDHQLQRKSENAERRRIQREIEEKEKDILHPRDSSGKYIERPKKEKVVEPPPEKLPIQKKTTVTAADGFMTVKTEVFDPVDNRKIKEVLKKGDAKGNLTTVVKVYETNGKTTTVQEPKKPETKNTQVKMSSEGVNLNLLQANPFMPVNQDHLLTEPEHKIPKHNQPNTAKNQGQKPGQANKNAKTQSSPAAQTAKKGQQQNASPASQPKAAPLVKSAPQPKTAAPQPTAPKQDTHPKPKAQPNNQKQKKDKLVVREKPFWEDEKSRPVMVGLGFLIVVLAFGYTFVVSGAI